MRFIFCDSGFSHREVEYMYQEEFDIVKSLSFEVSLISFEKIKKDDVEQAVKYVRKSERLIRAIYRGWMFTDDEYNKLYTALLSRNIQLINDPIQYSNCHYLPYNYQWIKGYTPRTIFKELSGSFRIENFEKDLERFDGKPIIVKDYVKSQKHSWKEACFIPNSADLSNVAKITNKFIELQGPDFNKGIVYREFIELEKLTDHSKSGMPLTKEFRLFVFEHEIISILKYWDEGEYGQQEMEIDFLDNIVGTIESNFFTIDMAKTIHSEWIIMEVGDGQVSGLPENANVQEFYSKIKKKIS